MTAIAVGLVLIMTGCSPEAMPEGDAFYRSAEARYIPMATDMHEVIMALHEGEWAVDQGSYGAYPISCQIDGNTFGYGLDYVRKISLNEVDVDALTAAATKAFDQLGLDAEVSVLGEGKEQEHTVVAKGGNVGRAVVTIRAADATIRVTARPECIAGNASDLAEMVFAGESTLESWRLLPATEGPNSIPQFYFPADGPLYYEEDGTPITPQPVVTEPPTAPYDN